MAMTEANLTASFSDQTPLEAAQHDAAAWPQPPFSSSLAWQKIGAAQQIVLPQNMKGKAKLSQPSKYYGPNESICFTSNNKKR